MQVGHTSALPNTVMPFVSPTKAMSSNLSQEQAPTTLPPVDQLAEMAGINNSPPPSALVYSARELRRSPPDAVDRETGSEAQSISQEKSETSEELSPEAVMAPGGEASEDAGPDPRAKIQGRLDELELQQIKELAARDREVRTHEQAHMAAGGQYAGAPKYSFEKGPDGVSYAVSGEVPIDVAPIPNDPAATIQKMQQVRAAALAPAEPSPQDRAVAALATQQLVQAQSEMARQEPATSPKDESEKSESVAESQVDDAEIKSDGNERKEGAPAEQESDDEKAPPVTRVGIETYQSFIELGQQLQGVRSHKASFYEVA